VREIEFRGKRIDTSEWVYGYYVKYGFTGKEKHYIVPGYASALYAIEVDPATVGQYTGLKDKAGTKIYEGDVLVWRREDIVLRGTPYQDKAYRYGDKLIVRWLKSGFTLTVTSNTHHEPNIVGNVNNYDFWNNQRFFEVIGNAHDNPDLLEATT
jgi:uncharacterized phage protein (TIGR01671 family)